MGRRYFSAGQARDVETLLRLEGELHQIGQQFLAMVGDGRSPIDGAYDKVLWWLHDRAVPVAAVTALSRRLGGSGGDVSAVSHRALSAVGAVAFRVVLSVSMPFSSPRRWGGLVVMRPFTEQSFVTQPDPSHPACAPIGWRSVGCRG